LELCANINYQAEEFNMLVLEKSRIHNALVGDKDSFQVLFKSNFKRLHSYAYGLLQNSEDAEEMVQQVFFKLWERYASLEIMGSLDAYLYRAVHNECINHLKHQKIKNKHRSLVTYINQNEMGVEAKEVETKELKMQIAGALNELPGQCRTVFQLSRFGDLKYKEIAEQMNISIKTVENHMGKAFKLMRMKLAEFLVFIFIYLSL